MSLKKTTLKITGIWRANKQFLTQISQHSWMLFFLQALSILLSGFSAALVSKTSKAFINSIVLDDSLTLAMGHIVFLVSYTLVMNIIQHFTTTYCNYSYSKAQIIVKETISKRIANIKLSFYDKPENRDILSRALKYSENGGPQLLNYLFSLLTNLVAIISILYVLTPFSLWIVFFLIALTIYKTVIEVIVSKKNYQFQKDKTLLNRKSSYFSGLFSNANVILDMNIYDAFNFFFSKYTKTQKEKIDLDKKQSIKINFFNILALASVILQNLVLYYYIGLELIKGNISVADFTMFFTAVNFFNTILSNFRKSFSQFIPMALEAQNYTDFINTSDDEKYVPENHNPEEKIKIECIETIEFKNVSFKYPLKDNYILNEISFVIKRGEIISLVGINGAGKTTLIKLLLGLYAPTEGEILINNISLDKINILSFWQCCGTMFQQFNIYSTSAYENITFKEFSDENTDGKNIDEILIYTDLMAMFEKHENGIHTELSRSFDPKGVALSGGERQKVALARLCYYNSNLLILDEPSSALDAKAENDLFRIIDHIHQNDSNKIIMFVSHRLSSSVQADKIIFIKNGAATHIGDHSYMMESCPEYKELFLMQAKNYTKTKG